MAFSRHDTPVRVTTGPGGLARATLTTAHGDAGVCLQGAHVTHWQPRGATPVLFLSTRAEMAPGRPIRGGVPVVFPWFATRAGAPTAPAHGFARTRPWRLDTVEQAGDAVTLTLLLEADETTRRLWRHDFLLRYRITLASTLTLALEVVNTSSEPWAFENALHTYLAVGDVTAVTVEGLAGASFIDKTDGMRRKRQDEASLRIVAETDRVYVGTRGRCVVDDPVHDRRLVIDKHGSATTVVWNPGAERAAAVPDLGPGEWRHLLCVETANAADDALRLAPGERHEMVATLAVAGGPSRPPTRLLQSPGPEETTR